MPRDNKGRFISANMSGQYQSNSRSGGSSNQDIHEKRARSSENVGQQKQNSPSTSPIRKKSNQTQNDTQQNQVHNSYPDDLLYPQYLQNSSNKSIMANSTGNNHDSSQNHDGLEKDNENPPPNRQHMTGKENSGVNYSQSLQPFIGGNQNFIHPQTGNPTQGNLLVLSNAQGLPLTPINLEDVITRVMSGVMGKLDSMSADLKQVSINKEETEKLKVDITKVQNDFSGINQTFKDLQNKEEVTANNQKKIVNELNSIRQRLDQRQDQPPHPPTQSHTPEAELEYLKSQANSKANNLIIEGLAESDGDPVPETEALDKVTSFLSKSLALKNLDIDSAFRLGKIRQGSKYPRPIMVRFIRPRERDAVWNARSQIPRNDDNPQIRINIKEDLPPKLRTQMAALLKVAQVAKRYPESFQNVFVKDFKVHVNGISYYAHQLELLPTKLRPSEFSTPGNDDAVAFYTRNSRFSNHYQSKFVWDQKEFSSMEQYLAWRRARIAGRRDLAELAMTYHDPADSKKIMNELRSAPTEPKWVEMRHDILYSGLLAKFTQRRDLMDYLLESENRRLGEASRDMVWGIGLALTDRFVLSPNRWKGANLLGTTLMEVRQELAALRQPPNHPANNVQKEAPTRPKETSSTKEKPSQ